MISRQVTEEKQVQGVDEKVIYTIDTGPWGGTPSNVAVVVKETYKTPPDVTLAVTTGSSSVAGDVITLPKIQLLTQGKTYRVEVKFDTGGNTLECYFLIKCEL